MGHIVTCQKCGKEIRANVVSYPADLILCEECEPMLTEALWFRFGGFYWRFSSVRMQEYWSWQSWQWRKICQSKRCLRGQFVRVTGHFMPRIRRTAADAE